MIVAGVFKAVLVEGRLDLILLGPVVNGLVWNGVEGVLQADVQLVGTRADQVGLFQPLFGVDQWKLGIW